jgi:hypothetical protein
MKDASQVLKLSIQGEYDDIHLQHIIRD